MTVVLQCGKFVRRAKGRRLFIREFTINDMQVFVVDNIDYRLMDMTLIILMSNIYAND